MTVIIYVNAMCCIYVIKEKEETTILGVFESIPLFLFVFFGMTSGDKIAKLLFFCELYSVYFYVLFYLFIFNLIFPLPIPAIMCTLKAN